MQTQNIQPEFIQEEIAQTLSQPSAQAPMHRTDIEGFGHHEDRLEMEQYAGTATTLPVYNTSQMTTP